MTRFILFLGGLLFVAGCNEPAPERTPIDRNQVKKDLVHGMILPANAEFALTASALARSVETLNDSISTSNLLSAQQAWMEAHAAWSACSFTQVGDIADTFIHNKLYTWPANEQFIKKNLAANETFGEDFAEGIGSNSKGLGAIEYLLFGDGTTPAEEHVQALMDDPKRASMAFSLAQNVQERSAQLEARWKEEAQAFIDNPRTGVSGSLNQLVNMLIRATENLKIQQLQRPLGLTKGDGPDPTAAQAFRSGASLQSIQQTVATIKHWYFGNDNEYSLDELLLDPASLTPADEQTHQKVQSAIAAAESAVKEVDGSLEAALFHDQDDVLTLHDKVAELYVILSVDLASALGVQVTMGDNDGDS
ncbi:imelysin family protein [Sanyastnella coralliicola]|uniref:imelysin family protein n=1 Tax=Sanyastnella coralliicola TaxID=3069118 RepID=UPI0027BA4026|nr:imelysin family protein [Longitalea sp. SCSIO 12813]